MTRRLLHGTLFVTIYGIDKLQYERPGLFLRSKNMEPQQFVKILLAQLKKLLLCQCENNDPKLYATVDLGKARAGRTTLMEKEPLSPQWNENFRIYCAHEISDIIFTVKDDDPVGATLIGRASVPVQDVLNGLIVEREVPILDEHKHPIPGDSKIKVKLHFVDVTLDSNWSQGIKSPPFEGVPGTFFKQRQGCRVTLYQDAHASDHFDTWMPQYKPQRCWEDIYEAISDARHLIYITGWSVYTEIALIREKDTGNQRPESKITLGELLKDKANQGVTVLMLVWDDRTSVELENLKKDGLMATHDQETADYFQNTKVHCVLCPRNFEGRKIVQGFQVASMFTHHQKTIVVDSKLPGEAWGKRRLVSFLGGIDLCDGRYDTQEHPLFQTLGTIHHNDFHQPNFPGSSIKKGGPREPWHDIHCKLEGPVAWDVLYNFEQRWKKQAGKQNQAFLFPRSKLEEITGGPLQVTTLSDPERWNVQIFRSIDDGAASEFPETPEVAYESGLVTGKGSINDRSIQDAYIHAIRRAKRFIYIENQYFLGSSFGWNPNDQIKVDEIGALHLIPKELSLKIVSKIEAGERFTVYIVIPMWPEGIPESQSVQAILDWQRRTMEMMYSDISQALRKKGLLHTDPREYLTFFCLGNRETIKPGEYKPTETVDPNSDYGRAQKARRFMIYVHAKMIIVDDEYIIIGSANINQRSMDGGRDTEIAMGAFQPHHLATGQKAARGEIFGFRMALWQEHLGVQHTEGVFLNPESAECVQRVNSIAQDLWQKYSSDELHQDLPGQLLLYPIELTRDDADKVTKLKTLPGMEHFPDTKAPVLGNKSDYLRPNLTT